MEGGGETCTARIVIVKESEATSISQQASLAYAKRMVSQTFQQSNSIKASVEAEYRVS